MWFFKKNTGNSHVLISIGTSTVSGAYVHYAQNSLPILYFTTSTAIEPRSGEELSQAMLRALDAVGTTLIEQGAPTLRREVGSARVDEVLVSIAGPWQKTSVRTERITPGKPFIFTKKMLSEVVASSTQIPEDRIAFGESVIATILNGYEIPDAVGKKANRAEVVLLTSTLDRHITEDIRTRIRKLYHTHEISFAAFAPVAYSVLRDLYPHERDFLVLDVGAEGSDLAFVKGGLLVDVGTLPHGINELLSATRAAERMTVEEEEGISTSLGMQPGYINPDRNARFGIRAETARDEWLKGIAELLKTFAESHALPRTLFLIADTHAHDYLRRSLNSHILHALWLSDEPLCVISVLPDQFGSKVRARGVAESDVFLSILALYQKKMMGK